MRFCQEFVSGHFVRFFLITILALATTPVVWAQDPPPPPPPPPVDEHGEDGLTIGIETFPLAADRTFLCRTLGESLSCAEKIHLGERVAAELRDGGARYFFELRTHDLVTFEAFSEIELAGILRDRSGAVVAAGGGSGAWSLATRLPPGEYELSLTGHGGDAEAYSVAWRQASCGALTGHPGGAALKRGERFDGGATEVFAFTTTAGVLDRPGDVDVYVVELGEARQWLIELDGPVRFELKGAGCAPSLGVGEAALGATLARLPAGRSFLYVSASAPGAARYRLRVEPR